MWNTKEYFNGTGNAPYDACNQAPASMLAPFLDIVRNSHKIETRVKVAANPDGRYMPFCSNLWEDPTWKVLSGEVTESLDDEVTRNFSADVVADYWARAEDVLADLSPYKTMLRVERGIYTPRGIIYVPLGVFRLASVSVENGKKAKLTAYSQEADLRDHRYIVPPGVTTVPIYFKDLLAPTGPVFNDIGATAPTVLWIGTQMNGTSGKMKILPANTELTTGRNRLELVKNLVTSLNADFFFSRTNSAMIRAKPSFNDPVQMRINAVRADGVVEAPAIMVSFNKQYSRNSVYNAVVASASDTANTVNYQGIAYDNDPTSPTRWGGPFGKKPRFYSSPFLKSDAECVSAATNILNQSNRLKSSIDFSFVPNPLVEVGDVVEVEYPDGSIEKHIIRSLTISLTADGAMQSSTAADSDTQAEMSVM